MTHERRAWQAIEETRIAHEQQQAHEAEQATEVARRQRLTAACRANMPLVVSARKTTDARKAHAVLHGDEIIKFGVVSSRANRDVPGDYSHAVTLVITVTADAWSPPSERSKKISLSWYLFDSLDGNHWSPVEDTLGTFQGDLFSNGRSHDSHTRRFVVPFGPRLRLSMAGDLGDERGEGGFQNVHARIFWRGAE